MISVKQALSVIESTVRKIKIEKIETTNSMGRILASPVKSLIDSPPFDMSSMDGYAVNKINKNNYQVIKEIFAGDKNTYKLKNNQAIRVFTGSKVPKGSKYVIIQEEIKKVSKEHISINNINVDEPFIRKRGQDYKKNSVLLKKNHQITARDIGLLISSGIKMVAVYKKPSIAVIATGNELVSAGTKLNSGQIYASSLYVIKELIKISASECKILKIIQDDELLIKKSIKQLKNIDLIITTGGVSVGKKDLIKKSLEDLGMVTKFWKVKIKPGKPLLFGLYGKIPVFGLPGNAVSSYVCFIIFVLEAIKKMNSLNSKIKKNSIAVLDNDLLNKSNREAYYRGVLYIKKNIKYVKVFSEQDSSLLKTLSSSNCLVKVIANQKLCKYKKVEVIELSYGI